MALLLGAVLCAQAQPAEDPQTLVCEVVTNELKAQQWDQTRWMYVSRKQRPGGDQTKNVIETSEGAISRTIAESSHSLTFEQQRRRDQRLQPPTREAEVFHAMQGTMIVDDSAKRLEGLRGQLVRDVTFGWGILARLYKGGVFDVRQSDVAAGHWELTLLDVHITGKALFFKTIGEQHHEEHRGFREVPSDLTLAHAVEMLKQK